jgi:two-component system, OmpR family, sensor kinase
MDSKAYIAIDRALRRLKRTMAYAQACVRSHEAIIDMAALRRVFARDAGSAFGHLNLPHRNTFGIPNTSRFSEADHSSPAVPLRGVIARAARRWRQVWPLPLWARVPIVSGGLILAVALLGSRVMMSIVAREQESGVRRIEAVYLDGIATTVYPHVLARNLPDTVESLSRSMWFHQDMSEQRAIVLLPDGSLFADVSGPHGAGTGVSPLHNPALQRQLALNDGFVFDSKTGTGWASRAIVRNGNHVADLYVALDLKPLLAERQALRQSLMIATILASLGAAGLGFLIVHRMARPVHLLTDRLRRAQAGILDRVPSDMLPPAASEYGRLLRGYNDLIDALGEREALAARLAERERESVLGRLAATLAHEVRNPLGGMATALDTVRKFGDDPDARSQALDLIERGLWSIRDVVSSVLAFHRMPADGRKLAAGDLEDLRVLIAPELARRGLHLSWRSTIGGVVSVTATETRQIALNLLLNACEASPTGGHVGFEASVMNSDDSASRPELRMEVRDAGPGLPASVVAALTELGTLDASDPPRGLGIRVVRDLVRSLGGRITATAGDGGSRIVVALPAGEPSRQEIE